MRGKSALFSIIHVTPTAANADSILQKVCVQGSSGRQNLAGLSVIAFSFRQVSSSFNWREVLSKVLDPMWYGRNSGSRLLHDDRECRIR